MLRLLIRAAFLSVVLMSTLMATTYYVATNGNDSSSGTLSAPFATISKGASVAAAGDTVYVRGGTYHEHVYISRSGSSASRITIAGYPGETAIVDGQGTLPGSTGSALVDVAGSYVTVSDLTVRNSYGMGLRLKANYDTALRVKADHNAHNGILVTGGSYSVVDSCEVYYNSTVSEFGVGNWASGLSAARGGVNHATLRHNKVWNNWGEGLSTYESSYVILEDNIVWDNFSANIYVSDTNYSVCRRNLSYTTPNNPLAGYGGGQYGILMGDEVYSSTAPSSHNQIINNFVLGGYRPFNWWGSNSGGGFVNELLAYNTFVSNATTKAPPLKIAKSSNTTGSRIEDNVVVAPSSYAAAEVPSGTGLTFSHNLWSKTPPSVASGSGDIIGDPLLAETGSAAAGSLTPDWFKLLSSSPAVNKAMALTEVPDDYFKVVRGATPDIGGDEYQGSTSGGDTQAPSVPTGVVAAAVSPSEISLSWNASTDNVGVAGYTLYRNGGEIATVSGTSFSDTGLSPLTTYSYTVASFDAAGNSSAQSAAATATTPAAQAPAGQAVTSFTLINADTNQAIGTLNDGAVLNLSTLPTRNLNVRANTTPSVVGSVVFIYDGQTEPMQNLAPYAAFDDASGNYNAWTPTVGSHQLKATPYSGANATGTAGTPLTISFTVTNSIAVASFTLINADTDMPIGSFPNGAVLSLSHLPTRNLNVRADTSPSTVGSVVFVYDGNREPMQNAPPYAAFDDSKGDYFAWTPSVGSHVLTATPYTKNNGQGTAGVSLTVNFTVTQ